MTLLLATTDAEIGYQRDTRNYPWNAFRGAELASEEVDPLESKPANARRILAERMRRVRPDDSVERRRKDVESNPFAYGDDAGSQAWRTELRRAFGEKATPKDLPGGCGFVVGSVSEYGLPFWIQIRCNWCKWDGRSRGVGYPAMKMGCIVCGPKREAFEVLYADPTFASLLQWARANRHVGALPDWLADHGHTELYGCFWSIFTEESP